jgi:hypothetical protein
MNILYRGDLRSAVLLYFIDCPDRILLSARAVFIGLM